MPRLVSIPIALLIFSLAAAAQTTIAGTWEGETKSGSSIVLELAVKDTSLTGTLTRNGQAIPITDGKVTKEETFSFKAQISDQAEAFSGERAGDDLKVWIDRQGRESAIVLKRVKRDAPER